MLILKDGGRKMEVVMLLIPKNTKNIFLVVLLTKLCVLTIGLANPL